jgi:glutamate-1-semialdehyde 2,1-aminomutase
VIPGGVSSPARAFGAVGGEPLFAARAEGAYLWDTDGNRFIDYIQGFGAVILGHADPRVADAIPRWGAVGLSTEAEVRLASAIVRDVPAIERVRFVTSGTEASMTAARIARAATGRSTIVKFEGCYHGHADAFLAAAGSGAATHGIQSVAVAGTIVLPFNDLDAFRAACDMRGAEIAAVFVEPVAANMGVVLPEAEYLATVTKTARDAGAVIVFDEVVTGFRIGVSGAQGAFGLEPDLTMLGKVIGGGLPIGAVGGRAELMDMLVPEGPVYQAGTFAAHPHAMSAGVAVLEALDGHAFATLERTAIALERGLVDAAAGRACVTRARTFLSVFFRDAPPANFTEAADCDRAAFARFHRAMRSRGVLLPPSPFEAWFPSLAHGEAEIEATVRAAHDAFEEAT